ncbi:LRR receptor-like serine/threonine-protein kinase ERL1 [Morus notabilis]|uniref:LRR receptor-like serine/threonine-protein kinase ERL1 n=1 Tax=Morus notabilis TaxID=981085 RepID=W9SBZ2_9ROSA|nr:LRR receptor-like serine/threonine-protein kinase ERL1 [Morus notabilis]
MSIDVVLASADNLPGLAFVSDLARNQLTGEIPRLLYWNEVLQYLSLQGNRLTGKIPEVIGLMQALAVLDLSENELVGPIPAILGNLSYTGKLYLHGNKLTGPIPPELGNMSKLSYLDLSSNNFSGPVPASVGDLEHLLTLILNNNNLHGEIPGQLANCFSLATLKLSVLGSSKLVILHMDMAIHTFDDIMRITENFSEKYIIGYGASSTVYKCVLKNSRPIAIKRLYNQHPQNLREFETELETIGSIRHRNIVSLHGYSLSLFGNLLFYDYMENGSLWDLLHGPSKKVKLDWETRLRIAVGAAQGLSYLHHDCNPRIIHRDVKSSNILLDENFEAHLSDFGIAKSIPTAKTHASTYVLGTIGYIDPEYARTSRLNEKSDVYSFGIVLLELLTGKKAVDNESNLHQLILSKADNNTVMEAVDPEVSVTCMDLAHVRKTFQLALLCTKRNPSERPTMHEIARVLVSLLPAPAIKPCPITPKTIDYAKFVVDKGGQQPKVMQPLARQQENNSSDAQWFVRFGEVISKNTL